jgi:hypothetical protein
MRVNVARARWSATSLVAMPALSIAIVAAGAQAQRGATPVVPAISLRTEQISTPDTIVYRRTITRGGVDSVAGTRTVVLRAAGGPGTARLLEVEQRFPGGGGEIVDTAIAELETLRAVAHRSHQPTRTMRFDFVGNVAQGLVTSRSAGDSATRSDTVRQTLGGAIYDSNVIDLVVGALPLAPQFSAELPFFIYERGGRVPMQVTVRERAMVSFPHVGRREAWVVAVGVPDAPATVWVDTRTRAVLRVRYDIAARATSFTDDRVTPLRPPS